MKLPLYQIDAFTGRMFGGNPAAVVLLDAWLPDDALRAIAAENNLAETAFVIPHGEIMPLRWFTPTVEVDLCGHATLATADVLFRNTLPSAKRLTFSTRSGNLTVTRDGDLLSMDFPSRPGKPVEIEDTVVAALGIRPRELYRARDLLAIYESESQVHDFRPDFGRIAFSRCLCGHHLRARWSGGLRLSVFRATPRNPRGSCNRVCELHARAVLGGAPWPLRAGCKAAFSSRRRPSLRVAR